MGVRRRFRVVVRVLGVEIPVTVFASSESEARQLAGLAAQCAEAEYMLYVGVPLDRADEVLARSLLRECLAKLNIPYEMVMIDALV